MCHFPNITVSSAAPHYICLFDFSPNLYKHKGYAFCRPNNRCPRISKLSHFSKVIWSNHGLACLMTCRYHDDLVGSAKLQDEKCDLIRQTDTPIPTYLMGRPLRFPSFQYFHRPSTYGRVKFKKTEISKVV